MKYLLTLTYRDGEGPQEGTPEFDAEMKVWGALNEELRASGNVAVATGLKPEAATTVRTRNGGDVDDHRRPVRRDQGDPLLVLRPRRRGPRRGDRVRAADARRRVRRRSRSRATHGFEAA